MARKLKKSPASRLPRVKATNLTPAVPEATVANSQEVSFSVDTHLFRELGSLLVARDSTALAELVKNAYDADATEVTVTAKTIAEPSGFIRIEDNGIGITAGEFTGGFLRVASRMKQGGNRRSIVFNRRFTGAKGIGRLAAHKLSSLIQIDSISNRRKMASPAIEASIDWDIVESHETLDETADAIRLKVAVGRQTKLGTRITLSRLRRRWTLQEIQRFLREARSIQPPALYVEPLPKTLSPSRVLFARPRISESAQDDPGMSIVLKGDFESGEDFWGLVENEIEWVIELRSEASEVRLVIAPTPKLVATEPSAQRYVLKEKPLARGPFFDARIFIRPGRATTTAESASLRRESGIRIYMEGFRVLPYGESKDDWLDIARDYSDRTGTLKFERVFSQDPEKLEDALTQVVPNGYFGAVFLTESNAGGLEMLVNREGFNDSEAFDNIRKLVRWSVHHMLRQRAKATFAKRLEKRTARRAVSPQNDSSDAKSGSKYGSSTSISSISDAIESTIQSIDTAQRSYIARGNKASPADFAAIADAAKSSLEPIKERIETELELFRVLAGIGLQLSVFVHEIGGLLTLLTELEINLDRLQPETKITKTAFNALKISATDIRRGLERQASYLSDIVTLDVKRRRTPQILAIAVQRSIALLENVFEENEIAVSVSIPDGLRTAKMFPAELRAILTNLLTNAIKAATKTKSVRKIALKGIARDHDMILRIDNTGAVVDLSESERLFEPFVSTSTAIDPLLGQGMGLGLTITRAIVEQIGGTVRFVAPYKAYASAVELRFTGVVN